MPRATVSTAFLRELNNPNSTVWGLIFIVISHPSMTTPIRVVNDVTAMHNNAPVPYVLDGNTYTPYPFDLALFTDSGDIAETKITIQNVDRVLGQTIDSIPADQPAKIQIDVYASSDFELNGAGTRMVEVSTTTSPQYECPTAYIRNIDWDASRLTGTIRLYDPSREPWPFLRSTHDTTPGLFFT